MKLINLMHFAVNVIVDGKEILNIEPEDEKRPARVEHFLDQVISMNVNNVSAAVNVYTKRAVRVPERINGIRYIVPESVARALPERTDLIMLGPPVRHEQGYIIGWQGFAMLDDGPTAEDAFPAETYMR